MANQRNLLTGDITTVEDKTVSVSIERYNELIKKEALYDKLMEDKRLSLYVYTDMEQTKITQEVRG